MKLFRIILTLLVATMGLSSFAQEVDFLFIERNNSVFQTGQTTYHGMSNQVDWDWKTYGFFAGIDFLSGSITNPQISGPGGFGTKGLPLDPSGWDENIYEYSVEFDTLSQLNNATPTGTYTFSGTGSTAGAFTESVTLGAYSPIPVKLVQNYNELQSFNANEAVTISWESFGFTDPDAGFIEIIIDYWDGQESIQVWGTEDDAEVNEFGGIPITRTSVTIPAGRLVGSPFDIYTVDIFVLRFDEPLRAPVAFPDALFANITSFDLVFQMVPGDSSNQGPLTQGDWSVIPDLGWVYGLTDTWGYSYDFGYINVAFTPNWYYQSNLGWLAVIDGTFDTGLWLYSSEIGYLWTSMTLGGGWYQASSGIYGNMINP